MTDRGERIAGWLSRLVRIPSVSPDQAGPRAGMPGEAALADFVEARFRELGGEVVREDVVPGRPNVYGIWRGTGPRWMAVDVHMDTVSVEQMEDDPFSGRIAEGRVFGRGAVDTKATLAIVLALLEELRASGRTLTDNLLVSASMDEEVSAQGAPAFAAWVRRQGLPLDELAVAEPTLCGPVIGHKGLLRLVVTVRGVPAHSSQPHLGKNAIAAAAHLITALEKEHERLQSLPPETPVGLPTLTVTIIQGGLGANVVPDSCRITLDRRMVPGEEVETVTGQLSALARDACPLPVDIVRTLAIQPFFQPADSPWVSRLAGWSGNGPNVAPYGTNAWAYGGLARECVVIGPGSIDQAHGVVEWVEIAELEKMAEIYRRWWGIQE